MFGGTVVTVNPHWERIGMPTIVADNEHARVEQWTVQRKGVPDSDFIVMHRANGVACLIVDDMARIALVEQHRFAISRSSLEIPQGGIEEGENPEDAVRREILEETGLTLIAPLEPLGSLFEAGDWCDAQMHVFSSAIARANLRPPASSAPAEFEVVWMSAAEVAEAIRVGRIVDATTVAALGLAFMRQGAGLWVEPDHEPATHFRDS